MAGMQGRNRVESIMIRLHGHRLVRLNIFDFYVGIDNYGSGLIGYATVHTCQFCLGESGRRNCKASYKKCRSEEKQKGTTRQSAKIRHGHWKSPFARVCLQTLQNVSAASKKV